MTTRNNLPRHVVLVAMLACSAGSARAQDRAPLIPSDQSRAAAPVEPTAPEARNLNAPLPVRRSLLREGSYLAGAVGRLAFDDKAGAWMFTLEQQTGSTADDAAAPRSFALLPCSKLSQMQQSVESTDLEVIFEMTGRIYVYEGKNYVLPLSAPRVQRYVEPEPSSDAEQSASLAPPRANDPDDADARDGADANSGDSTEAIIQSMRQRIPVSRSFRTENESAEPAAREPGTAGSTSDAQQDLASEGTILLRRRGTVSRSSDGSWRFSFAADAHGLDDPPMILLPCLLLQDIAQNVQRRPERVSFILSGEVYTYRSRSYLLPTAYQIERISKHAVRE
ncbi:MAG: hypothetical protein ACR2GY_06835 [Phycisphaerales bacterium]